MAFLSQDGRVEIVNSQGRQGEQIRDGAGDSNPHSNLSSITEVDGILVACGFGGQMYARENGAWTRIDDGLRDEARRLLERELGIGGSPGQEIFRPGPNSGPGAKAADCRSIDGNARTDLYAVGLNGLIAHYDGTRTRALKPETDAHLLDVHCIRPDRVIVSGSDQTIMVGNAISGFDTVHARAAPNFYCVREFQSRVDAGSTRGLWVLDNHGMRPVVDQSAGLTGSTVVHQDRQRRRRLSLDCR